MNYVVTGDSTKRFCQAIRYLGWQRIKEAFCDKKGDWRITCEDDVSDGEIFRCLDIALVSDFAIMESHELGLTIQESAD